MIRQSIANVCLRPEADIHVIRKSVKNLTEPKCKLYIILAEKKRVGIILRRGPSKLVRLIKWDLQKDEFTNGQWFKGRIYEDLCDLSPDGEHFVYWATKTTQEYWTAVSRPPYLTALALWPMSGAWDGGGIFDSNKKLRIFHPSIFSALADGFKKPPINVEFKESVWNADLKETEQISQKRKKYGWTLIDSGQESKTPYQGTGKISNRFLRPRLERKPNKQGTFLFKALLGMDEVQGDFKALEYYIEKENGTKTEIGRCQWADWDRNGDLLFTQNGALYRVPWQSDYNLEDKKLLADFSDQTFEECIAPAKALKW